MKNNFLFYAPFIISLCVFTPAVSQDFNPYSAPYAGVGQLGLITNQTAITQAAIGRNATEGVVTRPAAKQQNNSAALNPNILQFSSSLTVRKRNYAHFVEKTRVQNPEGASQMAKLFASTDVIANMGKSLVPYGLRTDNMADAYTVYWLSAWLAAHGRIEDNSREQAQAIKRQAANALLAVPAISKVNSAAKQEFAETMLIQAAMIDSSMQQAKGNPKQLAAIAKAVRQGAKASGLDLDAMELTEKGFRAN